MAYERLEPDTGRRIDVGMGNIAYFMYNLAATYMGAQGKKKHKWEEPDKFMPVWFGKPNKAEQSVEEMKDVLMSVAKDMDRKKRLEAAREARRTRPPKSRSRRRSHESR